MSTFSTKISKNPYYSEKFGQFSTDWKPYYTEDRNNRIRTVRGSPVLTSIWEPSSKLVFWMALLRRRVGNEEKIADIDISPEVRTRGYEYLSKFIWMTKRYSICQGLGTLCCSAHTVIQNQEVCIKNALRHDFKIRLLLAKLVLMWTIDFPRVCKIDSSNVIVQLLTSFALYWNFP